MEKQIGRRIYFEKATGKYIVDTGERAGSLVRESTFDEDFELYTNLKIYDKDQVDYVQLEYGQYRDQFAVARDIQVDPLTKKLTFDVSDEQQKRLTVIEQLQNDLDQLKEQNKILMDTVNYLLFPNT